MELSCERCRANAAGVGAGDDDDDAAVAAAGADAGCKHAFICPVTYKHIHTLTAVT